MELVGKVGYGYGHKLDSEGSTEGVVERLRLLACGLVGNSTPISGRF